MFLFVACSTGFAPEASFGAGGFSATSSKHIIATNGIGTNFAGVMRPDTNVIWFGTATQSFWQRARAEETYRRRVQNNLAQLRKEQTVTKEALALAEIEHAKIRAELNPPPPPPGFIDAHREWFVLAFAVFLLSVVSKLALDRHREEAEIRALSGGYLSDGTEVAKFVMPDLFAPEAVVLPVEDRWEGDSEKVEAEPKPDPTAEFFADTPKLLQQLSELLKRVNGTAAQDERQLLLAELDRSLDAIIQKAKPWALRPAWQMSTALQLLVNRVAEKPRDITPSVLRTIAAGLDVLRDLSVPGIRPNLIIEPPLRILAADDDALCRRAVAYALQKAGLSADFAENGQQALEFARKAGYDMMFLDIQMPEMDGLTACSKIRETQANANTEVVFVTVQTDFQTRVQTTALGGSELLAKPFLVFELTVKAIICAARKRLALLSMKSPVGADLTPAVSHGGTPMAPRKPAAPATTAETAGLKEHFFDKVPDYMAAIKDLATEITVDDIGGSRAGALAKLNVRLVTLAAAAKVNKVGVAERAASAVESLARKLQKTPKYITSSTLHTLEKGIALLAQICVPGVESQLKGRPVRFLVVEDDPLARRAVVGALQLAFPRPDSAQDGSTALSMASRKRYDVVFTDIEMPNLDGFELCRKMRTDRLNAETPVVFITTHADAVCRVEAENVGGTDFISKPFLPIEITVKALTLAYEQRLNARRVSPVREAEAAAA